MSAADGKETPATNSTELEQLVGQLTNKILTSFALNKVPPNVVLSVAASILVSVLKGAVKANNVPLLVVFNQVMQTVHTRMRELQIELANNQPASSDQVPRWLN